MGTLPPARWWLCDEPGQASEILGRRCQGEFIKGATEATQSKPIQPEDTLEVCEERLYLFPFAA